VHDPSPASPYLDFIHLSQFASKLIGNETPCSLQSKGCHALLADRL
jgi:hypothetical protein